MSQHRKVSTKKYLLAFILTIIIFTGGIFIGILLEDARLNSSEQTILNEKITLRSLQLQQEYIESGLADCGTLQQVLDSNINELGKKVAQVIEYDKKSVFNQDEFELQLQDYFLTQMQFLFLANEVDQQCPQDSVKVLYFYDENQFDTQGNILDYLRKLFGDNVLVFSFDSTFRQEPMISVLMNSYDIKEFPSVVVGDTVLQGHSTVEVLIEELCDEFKRIDSKLPDQCS
ncbi:hypothetical protein HOI26_05785 [Candidatus Woesearchaeota archaeon]|jgi:hypothetical protein|nr:hypothetical protein [Candidatus Woesearchaeota archaeon]MBT5740578.1 hypothetical protein [Candidatus Woesearchaeota archaeon]